MTKEKPIQSYASLICQAIRNCENKRARLTTIYQWISDNFPYYRNKGGWQNSIRHNLTVNKCFVRDIRPDDPPGKGSFWKICPEFADSLSKIDEQQNDEMLTEEVPQIERTAPRLAQSRKSIRTAKSQDMIDYYMADMTDEENCYTDYKYDSSDEEPYWSQNTLKKLIKSPQKSSQFFTVFRSHPYHTGKLHFVNIESASIDKRTIQQERISAFKENVCQKSIEEDTDENDNIPIENFCTI